MPMFHNIKTKKGAPIPFVLEVARYEEDAPVPGQFPVKELEYVDRCLLHAVALKPSVVKKLLTASVAYSNDFLDEVGEKRIDFKGDYRNVLKHIKPRNLIIPELSTCSRRSKWYNVPTFQMELSCEWEIEHGMEWVVRGDDVAFVGGCQFGDPFQRYEKLYNFVHPQK